MIYARWFGLFCKFKFIYASFKNNIKYLDGISLSKKEAQTIYMWLLTSILNKQQNFKLISKIEIKSVLCNFNKTK
jgi:hypothetical protein